MTMLKLFRKAAVSTIIQQYRLASPLFPNRNSGWMMRRMPRKLIRIATNADLLT